MKIEIKLDNPKSCDNCPLLIIPNITGTSLDYPSSKCILKYNLNWNDNKEVFIRPKQCIQENGE
jgi:hypothetical protein